MKKIFVLALISIMMLSLVGCNEEEKMQALIHYMDYDTAELDIICGEMQESFNSVSSGKETNGAVICKEYKDTTLDLAKETLREAKEVADKIEDKEIAEVHNYFVIYAENVVGFIELTIKAVESGSDSKIDEANARLAEINAMLTKYHDELIKLGKKRGLEITFTSK